MVGHALCLQLTWLVAAGAEPAPPRLQRTDAGIVAGNSSSAVFGVGGTSNLGRGSGSGRQLSRGSGRGFEPARSSVLIMGTLSAAAVTAQLEPRRSDIERCARKARKDDSTATFVFDFSFVVNRTGRVTKTAFLGPGCLWATLAELDFGSQEKTSQVLVNLRFGEGEAEGALPSRTR